MTAYGVDRSAAATGSGSSSTTLLADGTVALTADWDVGANKITAEQLESDVATGTAPLIVASTTKVDNLNADLLDGLSSAAFVAVSLADAKGDIFAASAADTVARVAVGTDGYALTADSTASAGVAYSAGLPVGAVVDYAGAAAPTGWLLAYGQAVSRATYAALFAVVSTTYGVGDGSTTFNLPDLRGRVIAGKDDMGGASANRLTDQSGGLDGDTLGDTGGAETHTLTSASVPAAVPTTAGTITSENWAAGGPAGYVPVSDSDGWGPGGGGAHNNVQPTIILNKIIKYA